MIPNYFTDNFDIELARKYMDVNELERLSNFTRNDVKGHRFLFIAVLP